ncbi:MAG: UDP-2,3-diacylglucosamine diphosphatase LpxI, partial [Alphaproteobacteria bacterium]|nr:UDP-2,3-diacylglucosamine diphosphatase LpxI [Alphaproteobacteria bacterium]
MTANPLGLIAGGGHLPLQLARDLKAQNRDFVILAIEGAADTSLNDYNCIWIGVGVLKKAATLLREANCQEIFFLGGLTHPNFEAVTPDEGGLWVLEEWLKSGASGDDAVLRLLLRYFEEQGFTIADPLTLLKPLLAGAGVQGAHHPDEAQMQDATIAMAAALAIGDLDIGQAVVVCRKRIIAVEGAEGTDGLLQRLAQLPQQARG